MAELSIIIPAYNEESRIEKTLTNYLNILRQKNTDFEIVVVANGCHDRTEDIITKAATNNPEIKILIFTEPIGKGGAILEGFKSAEGDIIGFIDADDAFNSNELMNAIGLIREIDGVISSKWKGRSFFEIDEPFARKALSRVWNIIVRALFNFDYYDTQAGAKFFKKKVIHNIDLDFISRGFAFDVELLYKAKLKGYTIKELYIPNNFVAGSKFKIRHSFNMLHDILKLRFL
jgi:glycosyltransferase involved in cell wall biosynthesis